ncbi:class I SAM-dependent methyltransferase [Streptomyces sp. QH1-20]|uniref:class I SAM-dependent methyltransferase n=1 Tax=Streptomyces sp. QH1-20 TaxID=3240934 RepID=UPI003517F549
MGPGTGRYPAYLARNHGALIVAVEASPTQHMRAVTTYGDTPGVRFVEAAAVDFLR